MNIKLSKKELKEFIQCVDGKEVDIDGLKGYIERLLSEKEKELRKEFEEEKDDIEFNHHVERDLSY
jgi:hypothetical protein